MLIRLVTLLIVLIALAPIESVRAAEPKADEKSATATAESPPVRDRESAVGALLERQLPPKSVKWLEAEGAKFLSVLTVLPSSMQPRGAVLIVSGQQRTLSDPIITALRKRLQYGAWISVAVQSPLATATNTKEEEKGSNKLCARLTAALAEIKNLNVTSLALVGIDDGASNSLQCFKEKLPAEMIAVASVADEALPDIELPSMSLRPELNHHVIAAPRDSPVRDRRKVEILLNGSNLRFAGAEEEIARHIRGWLLRLPPPEKDAQRAAPKRNS